MDEKPASLYTPYWNSVKILTWKVLAFWVVSILAAVLLSPMIKAQVFDIPLAYWLISGVLLLSFLGAVAYFAWQMDRLESQESTFDHHTQAATQQLDRTSSKGDIQGENQQARGG